MFLPVTSAGNYHYSTWTKERIVARGIQKRKFASQQKARLMAPENKAKFNEANPGLIDALKELTSWNSFAASLVEQFDDRGSLSDKQTGAAVAMLMKVKANKANKPEAPSVDLSNVVAMFNKAHEAIKTPKFRFEDLVISRAPDTGANAGALYVKVDGEYMGKVKEGKFFGIRFTPEDTLSKLQKIAESPLSAAVAYGRRTGACACCGRELTVHASIERGIGPICAERFGL
jgi:hypothetical protein|tara:strand:+ start:1500 stop:2192 length:693 start_codon:yes stop_codon:yes gene_type:complete